MTKKFLLMVIEWFSNKQNELEGEVFEVLSTFTDFMSFKEMFLDFRAVSNMVIITWLKVNVAVVTSKFFSGKRRKGSRS